MILSFLKQAPCHFLLGNDLTVVSPNPEINQYGSQQSQNTVL